MTTEPHCTALQGEFIESLIVRRQDFRRLRDFARAAVIQENLARLGVRVSDTEHGTRWHIEGVSGRFSTTSPPDLTKEFDTIKYRLVLSHYGKEFADALAKMEKWDVDEEARRKA